MIEYIEREIMTARMGVGFLTEIGEEELDSYENTTVYAIQEMDPLMEFYFHGAYDPEITYAIPTKLKNVK